MDNPINHLYFLCAPFKKRPMPSVLTEADDADADKEGKKKRLGVQTDGLCLFCQFFVPLYTLGTY